MLTDCVQIYLFTPYISSYTVICITGDRYILELTFLNTFLTENEVDIPMNNCTPVEFFLQEHVSTVESK